jgi:2-oxoglutarate ferredoxin oxidoreductase subunit gamma
LNLVILGFLTAVSGIITANAMRESIRTTVPKGTEYLNILAFDKGYEYGKQI